ncbi:MAG TPA: hypothetical protein VGC72_08415 [Candidatus Elarobacter sp.]|jgi:hypothetical protein
MLATAALALASTGIASAQSSPMPASTSMPAPTSTTVPAPAPASSSMPMSTTAPAPASTPAAVPNTAPSAPASPSSGSGATRSTGGTPGANSGGGKIKQIKSASLSRSQVVYGLTHQVQAAKQLLKMKTVNFDNLRVYKLPSSLQSVLKVSESDEHAIVVAMLGNGIRLAQTTPPLPTSNGNNSPIQYLRDVLANINVSNALNNLNVLNNSNVNVNVALSNVLNNNKISIGQVVGLYIGGGGIITTITK